MSGAHARQCASQKWSVAEMQAQGCRIPSHQEEMWDDGLHGDALI